MSSRPLAFVAAAALVLTARIAAGDSIAVAASAHTSQQATPKPGAGLMLKHAAKAKKKSGRKPAASPTPHAG